MNNGGTPWRQSQSGGTLEPRRMLGSENIGARFAADRAAIERWEDEGGTALLEDERSHAGPGRAPWGGSRPRGTPSS